MVRVDSITVDFDGVSALSNISTVVNNGDFVVVVGPSGSGKTTLFDVISGTVNPSQGSIFLDDIDITDVSEKKRACHIGRLFQNTHLSSAPCMTVAENLALAMCKDKRIGVHSLMCAYKKEVSELINNIIRPIIQNIDELLDRPIGRISGGQRQIISFVMATLKPPRLLLLDEPTAALDPQSATKLLLFAQEFIAKKKITTMLITHDPHLALSIGNKLLVLDKGVIKSEFGQDKRNISPDNLIGQIDYQAIAKNF